MVRQVKNLKRFCDICRDGDTDVRCTQCSRVFHWDCLKNCNLISDDLLASLNDEGFCCPDCQNNEDFCYLCKDDDNGDTMLYCDGCPKSAHLKCLGLESEPDTPVWYCPKCDNKSNISKKSNADVRTMSGKKTNDEADLNSDSCYVCQKPGKLLGCDFCAYSYHPKCIETEVFAFDGDKWKCPLCRGEDPLKNMRHKRMTKNERIKLSQEWQNCIKKQIKQSIINRDIFLWENRQAISPFVSKKVLERLKRNFDLSKKQENKNKGVRIRKISYEEEYPSDNEIEDISSSKFNWDATNYLKAEEIAQEKGLSILKDGVILKDYQKYGVHWLIDAFLIKGGAILADEMGLGKTIQTLSFLSSLKALDITGPHLIVVPLSTVGNWAREARKFTPNLTVTKICGSRWEREHAMLDPVAADGLYDLYITTYETVVTEESFFVDNFRWQCIVLDEAHRIKNESGRIRHSMDRVTGSMRVLLTGTPLQNSLKELFTLLNFLYPDILQDSEIFEKIFQMKDIAKSIKSGFTTTSCVSNTLDDEDQTEVDDLDTLGIRVDSKKVKTFHTLLQKLLLRRTKDLVIKLPDKIIKDVWMPLSPLGLHWYKRLLDVGNLNGDVSFRKLLGLVIKMRICCSHPRGLVARSTQLDKLFSVFSEASPQKLEEITDDAYQLKGLFGFEHVNSSSKLVFLDKLLVQLHKENNHYIQQYRESYQQYITEQIRSIKNRILELRVKGELVNINNKNDSNTNRFRIEDIGSLSFELDQSLGENFEDIYSECMFDKDEYSIKPKIIREGGENEQTKEDTENNVNEKDVEDLIMKSEEINKNMEYEENDSNKNKYIPLSHDNKRRMHKVLIFTQFQLILDELENYCLWRGWRYMRLDGSTNKLIRELDIREFALYDNYVFVYLICTRAGGLGINLVSANHVVMYDEDWNPFVDLQAVDRAHRIGQTRDVHIWKLITEWSVEERMVFGREQKLKLDKMVIKTNQNQSIVDENNPLLVEEKLSAEEVTKLLRYGKKALSHLSDSSYIFDYKLKDFLNKKRVPIPDEDTLMNIEQDLGEEKIIKLEDEVDITEFISDEVDENISNNNLKTESEISQTDGNPPLLVVSPTNSVGDDSSIVADEGLWRSKRTRKPPPPIYNPLNWDTRSKYNDDKKQQLKHEKICFRCGQSRIDNNKNNTSNICCGEPPNFGDIANTGKPTAQGDDLYMKKFGLINCNRCPKSYHWQQCLGLDKIPPRTWICQWHECCLCFRRATQAGGLLIHCAECPTTFCIDCFPPEYARHQILDSFFENLNKRGWNVTRDSMIVFLCSKCKALKQQEIRKKLSKQQLLEEQQRRKKLNEQVKSDVLKDGQSTLDGFSNQKNILSGKKRNIEALWKNTEMLIRKSFERLFPSLLNKLQQEYIQDTVKQEASILAAASSSTNTTQPTSSSNNQEEDTEKQNIGSLRRSPWMRPPGEWLRLCDNCILPFHDINTCPFPMEGIKVSVPSGVTQIDINTLQPIQLADGTKLSTTEEYNAWTKSSSFDGKYQSRSYCSLCGLSGRMHTRRSCPLLTKEAEDEYEMRQKIIEDFITILNTYDVKFPDELIDEDLVSGWESYRKSVQKVAEDFLKDCFFKANLDTYIKPTGTAYIGRQNIARNINNLVNSSPKVQPTLNKTRSSKNDSNNQNTSNNSYNNNLNNSNIGISNINSSILAVQQRMNDAALSLARARYAAAAAAAASTVVSMQQCNLIPFQLMQNNSYNILNKQPLFTHNNNLAVSNQLVAAAAAAAAAHNNIMVGTGIQIGATTTAVLDQSIINPLSNINQNRKRLSTEQLDASLINTSSNKMITINPWQAMGQHIVTSSNSSNDNENQLLDGALTLDTWVKNIKK